MRKWVWALGNISAGPLLWTIPHSSYLLAGSGYQKPEGTSIISVPAHPEGESLSPGLFSPPPTALSWIRDVHLFTGMQFCCQQGCSLLRYMVLALQCQTRFFIPSRNFIIVFHTLIQLAPIAPFPAAEGCRRWQRHWFCSGYPIISSSVTSCNWAFSAALHCFAHFICWLCCSCILSVLYCNNLIKMSISAQRFGEHLNHNHTQE